MRLLCDEMLRGLARWLRAAGYDTAIADEGASDRALVERCIREERILLTKDRHLTAFAIRDTHALLLTDDDIDANARQLRDVIGIDWQRAPFTRCLIDNAPLLPAAAHHIEKVPESSRGTEGPLTICPSCGRVYWPGSHVRRMTARLAAWRG